MKWRHTLWMLAATAVVNVSMLLFHRMMSSHLSLSYAQLAAMLALSNLAAIATNGLSAYVTKRVAHELAVDGWEAILARWPAQRRHLVLLGLSGALVWALATPLIAFYLHLPSWAPCWAALLYLATLLIQAVVRGAVQGRQRFDTISLSFTIEGAARVGLAALLVSFGVSGALVSLAVATLIGCIVCIPAFKLDGDGPVTPNPRASAGDAGASDFLATLLALALFSVLTSLDVILVKHYYPEEAASEYARAALVAKSFLYATTALGPMLLPAAAEARAKGADARPLLLRMLGAVAAIDAVGLLIVWLFTPQIIHLLCGANASVELLSPLVRRFSVCIVPLALYQLVLPYQIGANQRGLVAMLAVLAGAYAALVAFWHQSFQDVVMSLGAVSFLTLAAGLGMSLWNAPPPRGQPASAAGA